VRKRPEKHEKVLLPNPGKMGKAMGCNTMDVRRG
jgi:hypothetical protein